MAGTTHFKGIVDAAGGFAIAGETVTTATLGTAGTVEASKGIVPDGSGVTTFPNGTTLGVGTFASAVAGNGVALSAARTNAFRVAADDGNAAIATGNSVRACEDRVLLQHAQTGDVSAHGVEGHVKIEGALTHTGHIGGVWGYAEFDTTGSTTGPVAGVYAMADLPTGAVIGSGGVLSGLLISSNTLSGTHTGVAVGIHCQNPVAGTFDYFAAFGTATGMTTGTPASGGTAQYIKVLMPGGKVGTIAVACNA